jgi:hypothetical protein
MSFADKCAIFTMREKISETHVRKHVIEPTPCPDHKCHRRC